MLEFHELVATEEHGVEDRGSELADPTAQLVDDLALGDPRREHEPFLRRPLPHDGIDREHLAWPDHASVQQVGDAMDVRDPWRTAREIRGEAPHNFIDTEGPGLGRAEARLCSLAF